MFHMSIIMAQYWIDGGRRVKAWPRVTTSYWLPCSLLQHSQVSWQPTSELKITAWAPHWLHLSSGCGLCPDEVLKGSLCKWVLFWRRGAKRTDTLQLEGPASPDKLQLEGLASRWLEAERCKCLPPDVTVQLMLSSLVTGLLSSF